MNRLIGITIVMVLLLTSCIYVNQSSQGKGCEDSEVKVGEVLKAGTKKCSPTSH